MLSNAEIERLTMTFNKLLVGANQPEGGALLQHGGDTYAAHETSLDRLLHRLADLCDMCIQLVSIQMNHTAGPVPESTTTAAPPAAPKPRGRPPKEKTAEAKAATDKAMDNPHHGHKPEDGAGEMFPTDGEIVDNDPFGIEEGGTEEAEEQPMTETQVKDVLKRYMQKHGTEGSAKLTALLQKVGKVKRFSELPAEHWPALVKLATAE